MMFTCPELEGKEGSDAIITGLLDPKTSKLGRYDTPSGRYDWFSLIFTQKRLNTYYHANILVKKYLQSLHLDYSMRTNATVFSSFGVTLTDNSGSSAYSFRHLYKSISDHVSGFYWTILTETGVILAKPMRISTSVNRGKVTDSQIINRNQNGLTSFSYEGESGFDYTLALESDNIHPIIVDSTLKKLALNKYNSKCDNIEFSSGLDIQPLDMCQYQTNSYIIMSKKPGVPGVNIFIAVKESNVSYTFSAYDTDLPKVTLEENLGMQNLTPPTGFHIPAGWIYRQYTRVIVPLNKRIVVELNAQMIVEENPRLRKSVSYATSRGVVSPLASLTGTINIDWALSDIFSGVIADNTTFTFSTPRVGNFIIRVQHNAVQKTITFPSAYYIGVVGLSANVYTALAGATRFTIFSVFCDGSDYFIGESYFGT